MKRKFWVVASLRIRSNRAKYRKIGSCCHLSRMHPFPKYQSKATPMIPSKIQWVSGPQLRKMVPRSWFFRRNWVWQLWRASNLIKWTTSMMTKSAKNVKTVSHTPSSTGISTRCILEPRNLSNSLSSKVLDHIRWWSAVVTRKLLRWLKRLVSELPCFWCRRRLLPGCSSFWLFWTSQYMCSSGSQTNQPFMRHKTILPNCLLEISVKLNSHALPWTSNCRE